MQYLLDRFPPPASAGSCSRFLGTVHVWWVTVLAAGPGPAGHCGIGEATDLYLLGFYPVTSGLCRGTVHHSGEKKINHSWIQWQCHLQNHSPKQVWGHWPSIPLCFFVFCYILHGPWCWFLPESRSRCALSLSFMWAVTCTCPSRNDSYLSRVRHTWTRGHQSLGRLSKTNQSLQPTRLQPAPQTTALLATCKEHLAPVRPILE